LRKDKIINYARASFSEEISLIMKKWMKSGNFGRYGRVIIPGSELFRVDYSGFQLY